MVVFLLIFLLENLLPNMLLPIRFHLNTQAAFATSIAEVNFEVGLPY